MDIKESPKKIAKDLRGKGMKEGRLLSLLRSAIYEKDK